MSFADFMFHMASNQCVNFVMVSLRDVGVALFLRTFFVTFVKWVNVNFVVSVVIVSSNGSLAQQQSTVVNYLLLSFCPLTCVGLGLPRGCTQTT